MMAMIASPVTVASLAPRASSGQETPGLESRRGTTGGPANEERIRGNEFASLSSAKPPSLSQGVAASLSALALLAFSPLPLLPPSLVFPPAAEARVFLSPPPGYRAYADRLDGYTLFYPDSWVPVRGAGADAFFRDVDHLDENLSINISSPSSSRFEALSDLGPPEAAGERILKQYLTEFMSTRLGVSRQAEIVATDARIADDGREYYDIQVNVKSYATTNQLAIRPEERPVELEWSRRYLLVLGVENRRLYELRLQVPEQLLAEEQSQLRTVMDSFRIVDLTTTNL
eukprot:TRINITY_DN13616_c0_g1_i1.p1 TRINITY_DN13616_c0_g1~~TRINITY_DN13616_c0_g1_i1.p1  ORF type:complete len:287 (+),score=66.29 TRINITY_DN13616_c0_g1_i1:290-1150(+)